MSMNKYNNVETYTKNKETAKHDMINRKTELENKKRLISSWATELENIKVALEKIDSFPVEFFAQEPGEGLACDWAKKIIG